MPKSLLTPRGSGSNPSTPMRVELDSMVQGVSQQPDHLRITGQSSEQINGWSSPVEGLTKRNPARFQAKVFDSPLTNFYLEMFQISKSEIYSILISDTTDGSTMKELRVLRNGRTILPYVHGTGFMQVGPSPETTLIDSSCYLWSEPETAEGEPQLFENYVLINSGPLGLITNRTKPTAIKPDKTAARKNEGLIFIQAITYDISYVVTLDGTKLDPVTTPAATDDDNSLSTVSVAEQLTTKINAVSGFTATQSDYVVVVTKDDGTDFTLAIDDSRSNTLARAFTDRVSTIGELPSRASNGYLVNVDSDPSTQLDDRWLKFTTFDGSAIGDGNWSETVAPDVTYRLDENTMPFVIRREAEDEIYIGPADGFEDTRGSGYTFPKWGDRTAGNEETVPDPDFIGSPIRDHTFFRSRYAIAAGEILGFSEVDDPFNFFADSAAALTDSDAFFLRCSSEVSSRLEWLLPIDESLLAWSTTSQFQARSVDGDALTPSTSLVVRLSNIEMDPHVRPKLAAAKVLFATNEFGYTHFREFEFFNSRNQRLGLNLGGSNDITQYLPKYIKGMVSHWDVSESVDYAIARTPDDPSKPYIYKYKWGSTGSGLQKLQASWSQWHLGGDVQWCKFMANQLWLLVSYADRTDFLVVLADELEDEAEGLQLHLDRLLLYPECNQDFNTTNTVTASYDADTNRTTFTLPYASTGETMAVIRFVNDQYKGAVLGSTTETEIVCDTPGDWTGEKIAFGEQYEFKYEFSKGFKPTKDQSRSRIIGDLSGRTQIHTWTIHHQSTGFYQVRVQRKNRSSDSVSTFRARQLNVANNKLTTEDHFVQNGELRVPVYSKNTDCTVTVESTSHLPLVITGAEWEGSYSNRTK